MQPHASPDDPSAAAPVIRRPEALFAPARVTVTPQPDGSVRLASPYVLRDDTRCVGEWLEHWAVQTPDQPFLSERTAQGTWRHVTWRQAQAQVRAIGSWLLAQGLSAERPLAILCDNGIHHGLLTLGAMHVGVPVAPVSVAYSIASTDRLKLATIVRALTPGALYVASHTAFAAALSAIAVLHDAVIVTDTPPKEPAGAHRVVAFSDLLRHTDETAVDRAFAAIGPDTVAKVLFTSGSTGTPKGVINTQRMLCSNQQAKAQLWPFLADTPPVIIDWLPWSHTFGGNHNFNLVLRHGGTLHVDAGKPAPGLFETSLAGLREVSPTIYFNVPRGFDLLVPALRADPALRRAFFARLQVIFYAAAALPQHLWEALTELAIAEVGEPIALVSAWGSTETAPMATDCHFQAERAGVIGLPIPGTELKLVPASGKLEIRVRGANVMPGYWRAPEATAAAFDEDGFYRIGDAVKLVDATRPQAGLLFDGRIAEDFKLGSGTWVNVGALRVNALEQLAPIAQDIVVTGHDRESIGFLVVPNIAACRACAGLPADAALDDVLNADPVRVALSEGLARLHAASGGASSLHARAALMLVEPLSIDAGEMTDKGYVNQGAVLRARASLVERLHAGTPDSGVIRL